MFKRLIKPLILSALKRSPALLITGARQTGKTTLVKEIAQEKKYTYITFDNITSLSAAKNDPMGFIQSLKKPVILDEVQRVPEIFLPIKKDIDENRQAGNYILTGSANPLLIPKLGDSLVGRMEIYYLHPLAQSEIEGKKGTFIDTIFTKNIPEIKKVISKEGLYEKISAGGYPLVQHSDTETRDAWFNGYVTTLLQRDILDLSQISGITEMPRLLHILATRASNLSNTAELSRTAGISVTTLHRYLALLQALFIVQFQIPWSTNLTKRFVKSPKLYLNDSGLLSFLLQIDWQKERINEVQSGAILENFVVNELTKLITWSKIRTKLFHLRTTSGLEIDCVLENSKGEIVAIEIKNSNTVSTKDFKHIQTLSEELAEKFIVGIVLYTGTEHIPFSKKMHALPINALWAE